MHHPLALSRSWRLTPLRAKHSSLAGKWKAAIGRSTLPLCLEETAVAGASACTRHPAWASGMFLRLIVQRTPAHGCPWLLYQWQMRMRLHP